MAQNNIIHKIIFTPRRYVSNFVVLRIFLITENENFIITEDNKKILI